MSSNSRSSSESEIRTGTLRVQFGHARRKGEQEDLSCGWPALRKGETFAYGSGRIIVVLREPIEEVGVFASVRAIAELDVRSADSEDSAVAENSMHFPEQSKHGIVEEVLDAMARVCEVGCAH